MDRLVTVGIPTYNRGAQAERAVRSALAQDHRAIEVVVSDDASSDDTRERLERLAAQDPRVRYMRNAVNVGHARNFQAVLDAARGAYFMWLSDDDWLEARYVSKCLAALEEPGTVLVGGLARYHAQGHHMVDERPTDLLSPRPGARVLAYVARVNVNGALYGLARRADFEPLGFPDEVGGDWQVVAALAARGRIRTLRDVHIHRSAEGLSANPGELAGSFGMGGVLGRHHHVVVAATLARAIARSPAYAMLGPAQRAVTAALAAALIVLRFPGLHMVRALLEKLGLGGFEPRVTAWVRSRD